MKKPAHGAPIYISNGTVMKLNRIETFSEKELQDIIFDYPESLPISSIDEAYNPLVSICKEMWTASGPLDIFMATPNGDIVVVETKLWYNPEARRKVIAQILDYAKELSKWSYSDLQREVNKRLKSKGNVLYSLVAGQYPDMVLSEMDFVDAVSRNLRLGKILLLIVGDGIREGAKEISNFLNNSGFLNFGLALVEMPMYQTDLNEIVIFPRTTLRTTEIQRVNIEVPEGLKIVSDTASEISSDKASILTSKTLENRAFYSSFWEEFLDQLTLTDPGQMLPSPTKSPNLNFYPDADKSCWISTYLSRHDNRVGVYFRFSSKQSGQRTKELLTPYVSDIKIELGSEINWQWDESTYEFSISRSFGDEIGKANKKEIFEFFNKWVNRFVEVLRPRLKSIN